MRVALLSPVLQSTSLSPPSPVLQWTALSPPSPVLQWSPLSALSQGTQLQWTALSSFEEWPGNSTPHSRSSRSSIKLHVSRVGRQKGFRALRGTPTNDLFDVHDAVFNGAHVDTSTAEASSTVMSDSSHEDAIPPADYPTNDAVEHSSADAPTSSRTRHEPSSSSLSGREDAGAFSSSGDLESKREDVASAVEEAGQDLATSAATLAETAAALYVVGQEYRKGQEKGKGEGNENPRRRRPEEEARVTGENQILSVRAVQGTVNGALKVSNVEHVITTEDPPPNRRPKQLEKAQKRRQIPQYWVGSSATVKRVLGIPEPGERKPSRIRKRAAQVRKQMETAVRNAQHSAAAEFISGAFFIIVPLTIGTIVYTAVGHFISTVDNGQPMSTEIVPNSVPWWNQLSESWKHWFTPDQAAGAAGAFAGFAGVGIAAKTAAPVAALMTSSASELDTLWRSFGGASLFALYWKTFVFGKTFRAVEWDLSSQDMPEGPMHSLTIRVPSLNAVKAKIAVAAGLKDPSTVMQLALWVPGSGDFVEPLEQAKDLTLVPELGFIVWSTTPPEQTTFPNRVKQRSSRGKNTSSSGEVPSSSSVAIIEAISSAWADGLVGPLSLPTDACCEGLGYLNDRNNRKEFPYQPAGDKVLQPMTELERDELINLAAREDRGMHILFQALGSGPAFIYHALYYVRSNNC